MKNLDLFEYYEYQPKQLRKMVDKYLEMLEEETDAYQLLKEFKDAVYTIGYTFDYGLDAIPYNLRPI